MSFRVAFPGLLRFVAGSVGSTLAGLAAFRRLPFDFGDPSSQVVTMGALASAILALVRTSRPVQVLRLVGAFALLQLGLTWGSGAVAAVAMTLWSVFVGLGMFLVAVIYDALARAGIRLGKFLVVGPLLGGIYFAATPMLSFVHPEDVIRSMWWNAFLGILIGDGVGAAVELAELVVDRGAAPVPRPQVAGAAAPPEAADGGR